MHIYWQDYNSCRRLVFHAWAQFLGGCVLVFPAFARCWVCYFRRSRVQPINCASAWCQGYFVWPVVWSIACLAARISCFVMSRILQFLRLNKTTKHLSAQFAKNTLQKALIKRPSGKPSNKSDPPHPMIRKCMCLTVARDSGSWTWRNK